MKNIIEAVEGFIEKSDNFEIVLTNNYSQKELNQLCKVIEKLITSLENELDNQEDNKIKMDIKIDIAILDDAMDVILNVSKHKNLINQD